MAARICTVPYDKRTWDDVPHTNPHATVQRHRKVLDVMALCVDKASIRNATVSGWFEVADAENPLTYEDGSLTVQVKCYWYELRPKSGKRLDALAHYKRISVRAEGLVVKRWTMCRRYNSCFMSLLSLCGFKIVFRGCKTNCQNCES